MRLFREWATARSLVSDGDLYELDSHFAAQAGLPVLSALHALRGRLYRANQYISAAEMMAELSPIINLAVGEATVRAKNAGLDVEIPGIPSMPNTPTMERLIEELS